MLCLNCLIIYQLLTRDIKIHVPRNVKREQAPAARGWNGRQNILKKWFEQMQIYFKYSIKM